MVLSRSKYKKLFLPLNKIGLVLLHSSVGLNSQVLVIGHEVEDGSSVEKNMEVCNEIFDRSYRADLGSAMDRSFVSTPSLLRGRGFESR